MSTPQNWTDPSIGASEHTEENINAKRVVPYSWDGTNWQRATAGIFVLPFDELAFSSPDGNGNYQTITSKLSGNNQNVIAVSYDANNNITDLHRTT